MARRVRQPLSAATPVLRRWTDHRDPTSWSARGRQRRFAEFLAWIGPMPRPVRILDVGGDENYWRSVGRTAAHGLSLTIVNLTSGVATLPDTTLHVGDARRMPEFSDQSFDVVFSNSVIEHLGGSAEQQRMAEEVRRIGRRYWVQTPNKWFPIEPHFLFPGFAQLPRAARIAIASRWRAGWYSAPGDPALAAARVDEIRLLTRGEFSALFPGAEIRTERMFGLAKSFVACSPAR
ncbi:MAG: class I SAM-dependent methyltransferase [Gemmatimonadaceae bacterium]|nr:class I SAM-dependent methyltransferase [Gemmatimonadaceae bacterium]